VAYIRDSCAEGDVWRTYACSICKDYFMFLYRDKAKCASPVLSESHCTVCSALTLKGAAYVMAFINVLDVQAFWLDVCVTYESFWYASDYLRTD
jgi:hypothetical protein